MIYREHALRTTSHLSGIPDGYSPSVRSRWRYVLEITRYAERVAELSALLDSWMGTSSARDVDDRGVHYQSAGALSAQPTSLVSLHRFCLPTSSTPPRSPIDPVEVESCTSPSWSTSVSRNC